MLGHRDRYLVPAFIYFIDEGSGTIVPIFTILRKNNTITIICIRRRDKGPVPLIEIQDKDMSEEFWGFYLI